LKSFWQTMPKPTLSRRFRHRPEGREKGCFQLVAPFL
jgi:hypothetical protein